MRYSTLPIFTSMMLTLAFLAGCGGSGSSGGSGGPGLLLFSANDGIHGEELWVSDGTTDGTRLLTEINGAGGSSSPQRALNGSRISTLASTPRFPKN